MMNLDFSSVPSRDPLEEGMYHLRIAKVEEKLSSAGNPMLKVEYDVLEVPGNRKLWENYPLMESTMWKVKQLFDALGLNTDSVVELEPSELVGCECDAKVVQESYNGDTVNRIKKVM